MSTITATLQIRRDTAANWVTNNPTLLVGELGFETNTYTTSGSVRLYKFKIGDGATTWNSLAYTQLGDASSRSYFDFENNLTNPTYLEGRVFYDTTEHALSFYNNDSTVKVNIGPHIIYVKNTSGAPITKGQVVYINGSVGASGIPTVALAKADSLTTARVLGIMETTSVANNGFGWIKTVGKISGIDTSAITEGAYIYLSAATAGAFTGTAPSAPNYECSVGVVMTQHAVNGVVMVFIEEAHLGGEGYVAVINSGDQNTTLNTASDITNMSVSVKASTRYIIDGKFRIGCNNTGGVKFTITTPTGSTYSFQYFGDNSSNSLFTRSNPITSDGTLGASVVNYNSVGGIVNIYLDITVGATAGIVQFQFAAGVAGQTATFFQVGSYINARKI